MFGRFLGFAAGLAAVSVGVAGFASRSTDVETPAETRDDGNWTMQTSDKRSALPAAANAVRTGEVRIGRAGDSHFYADANIDGTNIRMMVDSGASIIALTRRDAEAIGIDVDRLPVAGTAQTAGGEVPMRTVMLNSVDIDGVEVRQVQAAVVDADMTVSLLGQSYLSKLDAVNVEGDTMTLR